ncbi:MAG: ThuA domain-containing protein [Verrucomicrobiae bacterium]|nr:ThuA domain-containing protein [Verrucomicrobiae bacterium]
MQTVIFHLNAACSVALAAAFAAPAPQNPATEEKPIRVLIVTGVDWKGHLWKETGPALREILQADPRVDARLAEDPGFLAADAVTSYHAIVLYFKNYKLFAQQEKAQANLLRFVENGGGLVVVHYASGAFEDWPEYRKLIGRAQKIKHDPRGPFTVNIVDATHPVTAGLKDFVADDELFYDLRGDEPIKVLAAARSKVTGKDHPMAFVLERGRGRVFHTTLGHDAKALRSPGTSELLRRGVLWASGHTVTNDQPELMPKIQ